MSAYLLKLLNVIFWSALKYILGFVVAIGSPPHFNFIETLLTNVAGGMIGVIVCLYLWDFIIRLKNKWFPPKPRDGIKMNKRRRWLVVFLNKYEIIGIALLTPVLLTPPIGTLLAAAVEKNKWKIKVYMLISFIAWTCVLYALYALFGIRLDEVIENLF